MSRQNYLNWDLRIVLDHAEDPAAAVLDDFVKSHANVDVSVMEQHPGTCSLKLNALSRELSELPETCEFVVLVDADVVTYEDWLHDMVAPFSDEKVGAATGVRWFAPPDARPGSWVRSLWNIGAIPQMVFFGIPWGGSLAIRKDLIQEADLSDRWSRMVFEDADLNSVLKEQGRRLAVVPRATLVNREATGLRDAVRYIRRQMLNARMYHPLWWRMFAYGVASSLLPALLVVLVIVSVTHGDERSLQFAGFALVVHAVGMAMTAVRVKQIVSRPLLDRRLPVPSRLAPGLCYALLTQIVYLACLLLVIRQRTIDWRGIRYCWQNDPFDIRMQAYQPYRPDTDSQTSSIV